MNTTPNLHVTIRCVDHLSHTIRVAMVFAGWSSSRILLQQPDDEP